MVRFVVLLRYMYCQYTSCFRTRSCNSILDESDLMQLKLNRFLHDSVAKIGPSYRALSVSYSFSVATPLYSIANLLLQCVLEPSSAWGLAQALPFSIKLCDEIVRSIEVLFGAVSMAEEEAISDFFDAWQALVLPNSKDHMPTDDVEKDLQVSMLVSSISRKPLLNCRIHRKL